MNGEIEVRHYVSRGGKDVFDEWLSGLADIRTQAKVAARINRLTAGNLGDCKSLGKGLHELRIDWRPGHRIYFAKIGKDCILLLCGGDKGKQASDIQKAAASLADYKTRAKEQ